MKSLFRCLFGASSILTGTELVCAQWVQSLFPLNNVALNTVATSGTNIFAGTYNRGIYRSTSSGTSWTQVNNGIILDSWGYLPIVYALAIIGTKIFAGTSDGVYLSTNNGTIWKPANNGMSLPSPAANNRVLSFAVNGRKVFARTSRRLFLSTVNGTSWTQFPGMTYSGGVNTIKVNGTARIILIQCQSAVDIKHLDT